MASLPPVTLGVIVSVPFAAAFSVRGWLERSLILPALPPAQPQRQFALDFCLLLAAGVSAMTYNRLAYDFPLVASGSKLVLGCAVAGFFIALDMALTRERTVIQSAMASSLDHRPPKRLYSMARKFSLFALIATVAVAGVIGLVISGDVSWLGKIEAEGITPGEARLSVVSEVVFVMAVLLAWVVNVVLSYSKNLKLLFDNETNVLERVAQGDLSKLVPVATNDEFGVIAGHTNLMIHGLRHRLKMITALRLAEELQQHFLPKKPPDNPGLQMSGTSVYCEETGGDYYDYLKLPHGRLGVVVADSADHGVGSALHMTTARAFLLFGARDYSGPANLLTEVNRFLTRDSVETGRFMTMFFLEIDPANRTLRWVRAGHDPAILYDPAQDSFRELDGDGMALGVVEDLRFQDSGLQGWTAGSIVIVGTDGLRETMNGQGEMFGRERLRDLIRRHADQSAEGIQEAVIKSLHRFRGEVPQEDDLTLVVIRLL
jgi:sigma-B regulation protein RsbU (phosphoserine phosphatase)